MALNPFLTIPEAIRYLKNHTGLKWTEEHIYQLVIYSHQSLHAILNTPEKIEIKLFDSLNTNINTQHKICDEVELSNDEILDLFERGRTYAHYGDGHNEFVVEKLPEEKNPFDLPAIEYKQTKQFLSPVLVLSDMVMVRKQLLENIKSGKFGWPVNLKVANGDKSSTGSHYVALNPWEVADETDPAPEQDWYVSARYFARQLVQKDLSLLSKREILSEKISQSLADKGIFKRGKKLPIAASTIKKALSNVKLK